MTPTQALAFVRKHGVVLEGAAGPVPSLAEAVAGARFTAAGGRTSHDIFELTRAVRGSKDVLVCRLVQGKITYVHAASGRLWFDAR